MKDAVIVTGASGVIGTEIVLDLARRGYRVLAAGRRAEPLQELTAKGGPDVVSLVIDIAAPDATARLTEALVAIGAERVHLVHGARNVSNLRIGDSGRPTREQWRQELELAVVTPYSLALDLAGLPGRPLRSVVNIASMYGVVAFNPGLYDDPDRQAPIHYGVAKAAMIHLTKELAVRLGPAGVRVNAISYGGVEGRADDAFRARYAKAVPQGRMLNRGELAGAVAFLISEEAGAITGHNLVVDGGWTIW